MANTSIKQGIQDSWSFVNFVHKYKKVHIIPCTNKETGEQFNCLGFTDSNGDTQLVGFSANLGQLSGDQIISQRESLQVVLLESGNYKLCRKGEGAWEELDMSLFA